MERVDRRRVFTQWHEDTNVHGGSAGTGFIDLGCGHSLWPTLRVHLAKYRMPNKSLRVVRLGSEKSINARIPRKLSSRYVDPTSGGEKERDGNS